MTRDVASRARVVVKKPTFTENVYVHLIVRKFGFRGLDFTDAAHGIGSSRSLRFAMW